MNLAGKDAERYSMLALNATTVALKGLKGTAHSIIYAGEQSTANNTCVNKPTGSGAATLSIKNNGETDYVYGGEIVSGVTLALNGGKQTLGNAIVNGNITVNQGALTVDGGKLNGTVSVSANGQLTATGAITLLNAISSAGTVDISGLESLTLGSNIIDSAQNEGAITTYTIINGGTIAGAEALTSDILKATIQADGIQTNGTDWTFANGKLVVTLTSEELTWSGGNLTWQDGAVLDDGGVFDQEDSVTFKTAGALTATLAEDITALNVNVDAATTLTIAGGENKLTVAETLTNAGTLVLASGAYDLKSVSNTGTIELGNVALHASENITMGGNVTISGNIDVTSSRDSNGYGVRLDIAQGGTWTLQDGAAVNRTTSGAYYINGKLAVADNATASFSTVDDIHHGYLAPTTDPAKIELGAGSTLNLSVNNFTDYNGATIELGAGSTLNLKASGTIHFRQSTIGSEGGTIVLDANRVNLDEPRDGDSNVAGTSTQSILGTLIIDKTGGGKTVLRNNIESETMVRTINSLDIKEGNTLELQLWQWNTVWNINKLTGDGDLNWNMTEAAHNTTSRLILNSDNSTYNGTITFDRRKGLNANLRFSAVMELAHNNAASGSELNLYGNGANSRASLAINANNVSVKGITANNFAHLYAGAAFTQSTGTTPTSTREDTTLTITGEGEYVFGGTVGDAADTASLNLVMAGTGTQTFSNTVYAGDIAVSAGELVLSGTTSAKDVTVSDGLLSMTGTATLQNVTLTGGELSLSTANIAKLSAGAGTTLSLLSSAEGAITLGALDAASVLDDVKLKITVDSDLTLGVDETKSITLISGGGATGFSTTNGDNITLVGLANGIEFESLTNGVLTLKGVAPAQKGDLIWQNADEDNTWLNGVAKNWLNGTDEQRWVEESTARFVGDATTGKGETITITGTVTPAAISVTGTDWEWTGDGSINCAGALTVGDGTADTELTISTTGTKTFTGGVTVNE
ncbi:MAG: hypothetical protein IKK15_05000, partial [Akkermansia sp.]|nr:hypothetical protein [Akkermansia sp.]